MSDDQIKQLWDHTHAISKDVSAVAERTLLLEHQAKSHAESMQRMMDRAEESDRAIRRDIQTMNGSMVELLKTLSEQKGAKNARDGFLKTALPWIVSALAGIVWLIESLRD